MNTTRKPGYLLLMCALGLSVATSADAADTAAQKTMAPSHTPTSGMSASGKHNAAPATVHGVRASKLIGTNVTNVQGENLGEINDLVINTATGNVAYAVLSFGGFMGMGDKLFAYPLAQFKVAADRDKLALNVDKAKLKGSPGFEAKAWPDFNKSDYRAKVDGYHGYQAGAHPRFVRASEILDGDVKDANRKDIGDIEDVVVDLSSGKVQFVVVEFDRAWNPVDKLVAVPLRTLISEDRDGTDLVYTASREELKTAPAFDKRNWPDLSAPRFRSDVDQYYRQRAPMPQRTSQVAPRS